MDDMLVGEGIEKSLELCGSAVKTWEVGLYGGGTGGVMQELYS
jgi:hypothetical protein